MSEIEGFLLVHLHQNEPNSSFPPISDHTAAEFDQLLFETTAFRPSNWTIEASHHFREFFAFSLKCKRKSERGSAQIKLLGGGDKEEGRRLLLRIDDQTEE